MNILVIGNGFDLAHGLPTKYRDFLEFCRRVKIIYTLREDASLSDYKSKYIDNWKMDDYIKNALLDAFEKRKCNNFLNSACYSNITTNRFLDEFYSHINQNFWLEYFFRCQLSIGKNWIDFEGEIKKIIKLLDFDMFDEKHELDDDIKKSSSKFLKNGYIKSAIDLSASSIITYGQMRDKLRTDLNKLIRALEIYLADFVNSQKCNKILPNIEEIMKYPFEYVDGSIEDKISYIISFNYTNTYERIYFKDENIENYIHYIHGKADIVHEMEDNNMVLGIDEFLPNYRKDRDIEFIAFKKFYQRICKETGSKYKEWIDEIQSNFQINNDAENNCMEMVKCALRENDMEKVMKWQKSAHENNTKKMKKHNLYIFGHSLDVTDKDILKELILNDNVDTTIFYRNQEQKEQQVANLVKVIGPDELIRRTGGSTKTITFEPQKKPREL